MGERLSLRLEPVRLEFWRMEQGLHDYAVLFGLVAECAQLVRCGLGRGDIKAEPDGLNANGHVF